MGDAAAADWLHTHEVRFGLGTRVKGRQEGPGSFQGRTGTVAHYVLGSHYGVRFDDTGEVEYLYSWWLETAD